MIGVVVVASGASKASTPEGHVCVKLAELCETDAPKSKDFDECVDDMKKARKVAGDASFDKSSKCIDEAKSCGAAAGCMAGGVGVGTLGEMMKGFGTALTK